MSVKSIAPIRSTPSMMPSQSVAPIGPTAPIGPVGTGSAARPARDYFNKLPSIGVADAKESKTDNIRTWHSTSLKDQAWMNLAKYMPSIGVSRGKPTFNANYVSGFSTYDDYFTGLQKDFGAGELKTYKTTIGSQNLYEYQYSNFLKYGTVNGPNRVNSFEFRDGRWWNTSKLKESFTKISSQLSPEMKQYGLTDAEDEALYQLAVKGSLSASTYASLHQFSLTKKFYESSAAYITSITNPLIGGSIVPGINNTMDFNEVYGGGLPDFSDFKVPSVKDVFLSSLSEIGSIALGNVLKNFTAGAKLLSAPGALLAGIADTVFNALHYWVYPKRKADAQREALWEYLWDYNHNNQANRIQSIYDPGRLGLSGSSELRQFLDIVINQNYNNTMQLTNQNGKIIDKYSDITNGLDKQTVDVLYAFSGISKDDIAAQLGLRYRARAFEKIQPFYSTYESMGNQSFSEFSF